LMKKKKSLNYDQVWENFSIQNPQSKYTWSLVKEFEGKPCLEIGCGNNPIIPLQNSHFLDASKAAVNQLKKACLKAYLGKVEKLPFKPNFFDLVVAWHVMEHVKNDQKGIAEISRVLKKGGFFLLSVPIWMSKFSVFDKIVGHERRYEPDELIKILKMNHFKINKYKADKKLFAKLFIKLFASLVTKMHQNHQLIHLSNLPKPVTNSSMKISRFLENRATSSWKKGIPKNLISADNLVLFLQKT